MKQNAVQIPGDRTFVVYVEKEDGSYGPVETGSVMVREYFDDFLTKRHHLEARLRADLTEGRISVVAYYATLRLRQAASGDRPALCRDLRHSGGQPVSDHRRSGPRTSAAAANGVPLRGSDGACRGVRRYP